MLGGDEQRIPCDQITRHDLAIELRSHSQLALQSLERLWGFEDPCIPLSSSRELECAAGDVDGILLGRGELSDKNTGVLCCLTWAIVAGAETRGEITRLGQLLLFEMPGPCILGGVEVVEIRVDSRILGPGRYGYCTVLGAIHSVVLMPNGSFRVEGRGFVSVRLTKEADQTLDAAWSVATEKLGVWI